MPYLRPLAVAVTGLPTQSTFLGMATVTTLVRIAESPFACQARYRNCVDPLVLGSAK